MSNQAVGPVYQSIIEEVINSSRVDFEENGVEESVLEELRLVSPEFFSQSAPSRGTSAVVKCRVFAHTKDGGEGGCPDGECMRILQISPEDIQNTHRSTPPVVCL